MMLGTLGLSVEHEGKLVGLWRRIRTRQPMDHSYPAGAVQQQMAYHEAIMLLIGGEPEPEDVSWSAYLARQEEDEPGAPRRPGAPGPLSAFKVER